MPSNHPPSLPALPLPAAGFFAGVIADAVEQAGLRAVLCYEVTDRDGDAKMEAGIAENLRFIQNPRPLVAGTFGRHASLTLNDHALRACADAGLAVVASLHQPQLAQAYADRIVRLG